MRWILRQYLVHLAALLITVYLIPGFSIGNSTQNMLFAAAILALINVFIKPIVKILLLPLNIITLNLFSVVINIGVIVILTKLVTTVTISSWDFSGVNAYGFVIPALKVTYVYSYLIISILITSIVSFLNWLSK